MGSVIGKLTGVTLVIILRTPNSDPKPETLNPKPQTLNPTDLLTTEPFAAEETGGVSHQGSTGLAFRVWGVGFGVWGLGLGVQGLGSGFGV